jgi:NIMA-interacting peptidyl-prolyl cis-trans isomerase 1
MLALTLALLACDPATSPDPAPEAAPAAASVAAPAATAPAGPRVPTASTARVAASHIVVAYAGAVSAAPNVTRSREEARARAAEARTKILSGADFGAVAMQYSDDGTASRGGALGGFERGVYVDAFDGAVRALAVDGLSDVVETPFGYHVIRRDPLLEIRAAHLVVSYKGAERAPSGVARAPEEARARADEAAARLTAGEPWDAVVRSYTDGPGKDDAGDLGWFARGQLAEPLDAAAFDLDPGAVTSVLETPRGFHLVKRLE